MPRSALAAQLMRTFTSPTAAAAAAARTRRIPNLQGRQHFPAISKGTEGIKWAEQKRFLSMERKEPAVARFMIWYDKLINPHYELMFIVFGCVSYFVATTIAYRRIDKLGIVGHNLNSGKSGANDGDGY